MNPEFITLWTINGTEIAINPDNIETFQETETHFHITFRSSKYLDVTKSSFNENFTKGSGKKISPRF